jgi:hypothetical protein
MQLRYAIPLPLPLLCLILQQALYAVERRRDCFKMLSIGHRARLASRSAARATIRSARFSVWRFGWPGWNPGPCFSREKPPARVGG